MSDRPPDPPSQEEGSDSPGGPPGLEESLRGLPARRGGGGASWLPDGLEFLRNPFVLAGLALFVALFITVIVLVVFDIGGGSGSSLASPTETPEGTPDGDLTPTAELVDGVAATLLATVSVRNGPSGSYSFLGTLSGGSRVVITGRNESGTWVQVQFPPNSPLRGWISVELIEIDAEELLTLPIAEPGTGPNINVPTSPPGIPTSTPLPELTEPPTMGTTTPEASPSVLPTKEQGTATPPPTAEATATAEPATATPETQTK